MNYQLCDKDWKQLYNMGPCKEYILDMVHSIVTQRVSITWNKSSFTDSGYIHLIVCSSEYSLANTSLENEIEKCLHYLENRLGFEKSIVVKFGTEVKVKSDVKWVSTPHHAAMYTWFLRVSPLFGGSLDHLYAQRDNTNSSDYGYLTDRCRSFVERVLSGEEFPDNDWIKHDSSYIHDRGGI